MNEKPREQELLEPLVRFAGGDAVLVFDDGQAVDLNSVPNPFTGEPPSARPASAVSVESDDEGSRRLGRQLRAMREDAGLTLGQTAELVGVPTSRVSQLEKGTLQPSLSLVTAVVRATGRQLSDLAAPDAPEVSNRALAKIATTAGASRDVVERIAAAVDPKRFTEALSRAFLWPSDALLRGEPRSGAPEFQVAFKTTRQPPAQNAPTLALARVMSELAVSGHERLDVVSLPEPEALRREILSSANELTLDALIEWAWNAGIAVVPLAGGGEFVAAVWKISDRPVIVLKESRAFGAYWLFDLAHELGHLAHGHVDAEPLVDVERIELPDLTDEQERQANDYALRLLLPDPDALLSEVRRRTRGDAPKYFKFAVRDVAAGAGVSPGVLGFAAAREMSDVPADKDRWGSAQNLAKAEDPDGRSRVEAAFRRHVSVDTLDELDATLVAATVLLRED